MKHADAALEGIYERDQATNAFIIATAIDRYADIFNELDPAPFKKRDINQDLRVFLEDCSADIPLKYNVILQLNLLKDDSDPKKEERMTSGLSNYFYLITNQLKREINKSYQKGILYMSVSFFLLLVAYSLRLIPTNNAVFKTLVEGVNIGGWVFLWEAISTFAFKKRDVRNKKKHYERFTRAKIRFKYATAKPPNT